MAKLAKPQIWRVACDDVPLISTIRGCNKDLRILAISGADRTDLHLLFAELGGANAVLPNPFDREEFLSAIEDATA